METIAVVAFLVTCSSDLLNCQTLDTERMSWKDPQSCNEDVSRLVGDYQRRGFPNVMGKCRYVIPDEKFRVYPIG